MTQNLPTASVHQETVVFDRVTGTWHARELFEKNLYRETFNENRREESVKLPALRRGSPLPSHP